MTSITHSINTAGLPSYLHTLLADLCEHSGYTITYAGRGLDGVDSELLTRKLEALTLNDQSGCVIDSSTVNLRNADGIGLLLTWGVFDDDVSSADADDSPKASLAHDERFNGCPNLISTLAALAASGFEAMPTQPCSRLSLEFIRGKKMAGQMRLGIHASISNYGVEFAGRK